MIGSPFTHRSTSRAAAAPTPRETVFRDGTASLYRFEGARDSAPLLLVPSMINRWYILDLREGVSLAASLAARGLDVWCLDWGAPNDEDRYFSWDDVLARLSRMVRRVRRETGEDSIGLLGYCMGGTLAGIHAALEPSTVSALVNLAGPFDFSHAGFLGRMTDPRWFDVDAIAAIGNVSSEQMQSGFQLLRPTLSISKWVGLFDRYSDPEFRTAFESLESWANDNIAFPAAAYVTYIRELYQQNLLVKGKHRARGRTVDLSAISCPVLAISADRDTICPPAAATALLDCCGATDKHHLPVPGGHVGAVVGSRAPKSLYPAIGDWLAKRL